MAIVLLWLPLWNFFFPPPPRPVTPSDTAAVASDTLAARDTIAAAIAPPSPVLQTPDSVTLAAQAAPESLVTIDTKSLRIVLTSKGGNVRQVVLKSYLTKGASLVTMLNGNPVPDWGKFGALTVGYNEHIPAFNDINFRVKGEDRILNNVDSVCSVIFTYTGQDGGEIVKTYTFHHEDYLFDLAISISDPRKLDLVQGVTVGWFNPLEPTELDLNQDRGKLGAFFYGSGEFESANKLKNRALRQVLTGPIEWVATRTKYFTAIVIARGEPAREVVAIGQEASRININGSPMSWPEFGVGMTYGTPAEQSSYNFSVYTGPLDYDRLREKGMGLSNLVDLGWWLFRPFAIAILWLFTNMHKAIANYGLVIIIFAILMKAVFWPLSLKTAKSMYRMKEIQPKLQEVKEKYKNDPAKMQQETMKAYKEYGVNPFGSCLPMLIQMPIFFALYSVLSNTIELRGADFAFWITDLSQPDPWGIPVFGFRVTVLSVLMGLAMFFQQKMTVTDPKQKMMVYMMPVIFVVIFGNLASGLVLYWTVFSVIGIFEQWMVLRHIKAEKEARAARG
jgi:YidC/Oxa1 family membrane protein insertase